MVNPRCDLWDWRRRIGDVYGAIRASGEPEAAWLAWRATRDALFGGHPQSPLEGDARARFAGLRYFPYDPDLRRLVELTPVADAPAISVPAGEDGHVVLHPFARTRGLAGALGGELSLFWIGGYGGGVFLPFADATSGQESYGGGRYVLDSIKGADLGGTPDGRVWIDFNFAYAPSCAYSQRYVCPLALPENRLGAAVRAGERL